MSTDNAISTFRALDLALEALDIVKIHFTQNRHVNEAITAIKQARALDKKAENARELGLDYEPADGTQVSKVWWDGEKLMAKPIPLVDFYLPASGCTRSHPHENMNSMCELRTEIARLRNENERVHVENRRLIDRIEAIDVPLAQPAPVQESVALQMDVIVVNLVREGINKHRARELAEHFIKHTTPPGGRQSEDCLTAAQEDIQRLSALVRAQQITIDKLEQGEPVTDRNVT